jgi:dihydroorotase-like cyclic amidohydrolase
VVEQTHNNEDDTEIEEEGKHTMREQGCEEIEARGKRILRGGIDMVEQTHNNDDGRESEEEGKHTTIRDRAREV